MTRGSLVRGYLAVLGIGVVVSLILARIDHAVAATYVDLTVLGVTFVFVVVFLAYLLRTYVVTRYFWKKRQRY